jgi:tetratricopeptide (TPR) repeat protein
VTRPTTKYYFLILCLLAAGSLGAYWPLFHCGFVNYDDPEYVTNNLMVRQGLSLAGFRWAFSTMHAANWHPLTWLSHMLDCQLFAFNPAGHHATNFLFHLANTLLLFAILRRMTGALWRSALVAAIFAWHPLHVESVAWIAERKDVLSTCFGLLSIGAYARYVEKFKAQHPKSEVQSPKSEARGQWSVVRSPWSIFHLPSSIFYLLSLALFACSLMSKPMLVTLPCLLLLLDFWPLRRFSLPPLHPSITPSLHSPRHSITPSLRLLLEKLPFLALSLASSIITLIAQKHAVVPVAAFPPAERIESALAAVAGYITSMLWPANLTVFYPYVPRPAWQVLCSAVLVALLSWLALRSARLQPWLLTGWLWFLVTLTPVIGLIQVGSQAMADRYSYVPLIGLFIAISWGVAAWAQSQSWRRLAIGLAAALLLGACLGRTSVQVRYWQDSESLFSHAWSITGDNSITCSCLGFGYLQKNKLDQALVHFRTAARLDPGIPQTHGNLALALLKKGDVKESMAESAAALRLEDNYAPALAYLGRALFLQGQTTQAIQLLTRSLQSLPYEPSTHADLADALAQLGQSDEAIAHYAQALSLQRSVQSENGLAQVLARQGHLRVAMLHWQAAVQLDPHFVEAYVFLGHAFAADNQPDQAIPHLQEALRLQPDLPDARRKLATLLLGRQRTGEALQEYRELLRRSPDSFEPMNNLAWILATHPDPKFRDGAEAVRLAERAARLAGSNSASAADTLAAAYAEAGHLPEAVAKMNKAIALAEASGQTNSALKFRARLDLYQAGKSFHETR